MITFFLHFFAILASACACSSTATPPIKTYVEDTNSLLPTVDTASFKESGLQFIEEYCPSQLSAAKSYFNTSQQHGAAQENIKDLKKKQTIMARIRSDLLFDVLLHDSKHRDILCQAVLIEHSGRTRQACPRQASQNAQQRIMNINLYESDIGIGGFLLRKQPGGGGDGEPPTPPPFRKPKLPDDAPDFIDLEKEDLEFDLDADEEKAAAAAQFFDELESSFEALSISSRSRLSSASSSVVELDVPISRTVSSGSCQSASSSDSTSSSVVHIQLIDPNTPLAANSLADANAGLNNFAPFVRIHFPNSQLGNTRVPRDPVNSAPLLIRLGGPNGQVTDFRGLMGDTRDFVNTCNIDSFLTHMILLSNGDPQLARKLFVTENSRIENGLASIIDRYWSGIRNGENIERISNDIKGMWIKSANLPYALRPRRQTDMYGSEYKNVYEPLKQNAMLVSVTICKCKKGPYRLTVRNQLPNIFATSRQINTFTQTRVAVPILDRCKQCQWEAGNTVNEYRFSFVSDTTWALSFECPPTIYTPFTPESLNTVLSIADAFRLGEFVDFHLGYLAYSTHLPNSGASASNAHQVSFHYVGNEWFFYDGLANEGRLRRISSENMLDMIRNDQLSFVSANYFRNRFSSQRRTGAAGGPPATRPPGPPANRPPGPALTSTVSPRPELLRKPKPV